MLTLWLVLVFLVGVGFMLYMILDTYFNKPSDKNDESSWDDRL